MSKETSGGNTVNILGIRGIPAAHGGFETFAEKFALYMVAQGWTVNVYCQLEPGKTSYTDTWKGVNRLFIGTKAAGAYATIEFDIKATIDSLKRPGKDLVLGYNTAFLTILQRAFGRKVVINMDGIEWKRPKWSLICRIWLYLNEFIGANMCNVQIADHPEIARHVKARSFRKPVMIPYGADEVTSADPDLLAPYGIAPQGYFISIARIEPENSILEIVRAASLQRIRTPLVVLGKIDPSNAYHRQVSELAARHPHIRLVGAIYDKAVVNALRFHALAYMHGHQVGGTNPSLVEALAARNAVIAHDNIFNRWTTGNQQLYFASVESCVRHLDDLAADRAKRERHRQLALERFRAAFTWDDVLTSYRTCLATC